MNLPTLLTLTRIAAIPVVMVCYYLPFSWGPPLSSLVFILAAITDWFDGYLARTMKLTTSLGAFLDPVADKLLVAAALIIVLGRQSLPYLAIPVVVIVGREIMISALREWMAEIGKRTSVAVTYLGKIKTTFQMIAVILLLWYSPGFVYSPVYILWLGVIALYFAAALTLWSMCLYLKVAWNDLTLSRET